MDVSRSIRYVFEDPQWVQKMLIGSVIFLASVVINVIPLVGLAALVIYMLLYGYCMRIVLQVAEGRDSPLPEWDDFGGDLLRGFRLFVANLVWLLPVFLLIGCMGLAAGVGEQLESANADPSVGALFGATVLGFVCLALLIALPVVLLFPVITARVALTDSIRAGLDVKSVIADARQAFGNLFVILVMTIVAVFLAMLGVIACFIGVAFTMFLALVMLSHLYGQIAREVREGMAPRGWPEPAF